MLGYRIYTDDFGSPFIRAAGVPITDPNFLEWVQAPDGGVMRYVPKFPADPAWSSWPIEARAIVPEEWSGDLMRGGPGSNARGAKDVRLSLTDLVWNWGDKGYAVNPGESQLRAFLRDLQWCGWGRWVGVPSSKDGRVYPCITKTSVGLDAFAAAVADHFRAVGGQIGAVLRLLAKALSFVPGVGTVLAAVFAGLGSLAAGEPIDAAILDSVANAVPGGGIAKDALKSGVAAARKLIEGGSLGEAALAASRSAIVSYGVPPEALAAFDIGVALGTGKGLQEAGFRAFALFAPGNDLIERGIAYTKAIAKSVASAIPIEQVLQKTLGDELSKVDASGLGDAIAAIVEQPTRLAMGSYELAEKLGVPEAVARAAQAVMSDGSENYELRDQLLAIADKATMDRIRRSATELTDTFRAEQAARDAAQLQSTALVNSYAAQAFRAEKDAREAALLQSSLANDASRNYAYQYQLQTGVDVTAAKEIARRQAEEAALTTTAPAPRESRSTTGQDVALGLTVGAAVAALYLWAKS